MNMRQGSRNDNGLVRIGFLYTRKRPAGLSEPGSRAPAQITNPEETQKSVTNPKSQIT